MANYHILEGEGNHYRIAFHLPVPDEQNLVTTSTLRAALAEDGSFDKTSEVSWITGAEQTQLTNGELFEHIETYSTHEGHTNVQDQAALDARFTELIALIAVRLRRRYTYWRFERNVV